MASDTLYHYCPSEAFFSIVENKNIWASDFFQSNDSSEAVVIKSAAINYMRHHSISNEMEHHVICIIDFCIENSLYFGFSFTNNGDLLSQWRGYSDGGKGVCIGFDRKFLEEVVEEKFNVRGGAEIGKVCYISEREFEPVNNMLRFLCEKIHANNVVEKSRHCYNKGVKLKYGDVFSDRDIEEIITSVVPCAIKLKDNSFREEAEERLIIHSLRKKMPDFNFRCKNGSLIPYDIIDLDPKRSPINRVVLGAMHKTQEEYVGNFLYRNGFCLTQVERSSIPLR